MELGDQHAQYNSVKGRAEVNKQHLDIRVMLFQMGESCVESLTGGILSRSVYFISNLMLVYIGSDSVFDVVKTSC